MRNPVLEKVIATALMWRPKFVDLVNIKEVANKINLPHEDYPTRVERTQWLIQNLIDDKVSVIGRLELLTVHSSVMFGLESRGKYRNVNVRVGNYYPPEHFLVDDLLKEILPVTSDSDLIQWYSLFETIHPFEDGNGRVGGILISALSFMKNGIYLTPCQ